MSDQSQEDLELLRSTSAPPLLNSKMLFAYSVTLT